MRRVLFSLLLLSGMGFGQKHAARCEETQSRQLSSTVTGAAGLDNVRHANRYAGVDACAKIAAALADLAPTKGIVDARAFEGLHACATNPFARYSGSGGLLLLGAATFATSAQWVVPSQFSIRGVGTGLAGESGWNTVIQAAANFPRDTAVVRLANGGAANHASMLHDLTIDCNGVTGTSGLYSTDANEKSGAINIAITNCPRYGVNFDATQNKGRGGAQSYVLRDIEVYPNFHGTASTIGVRLVGDTTGGPADLANITVVGAQGHTIGKGFLLANYIGGAHSWLHAEIATTGIQIGDARLGPIDGATIIAPSCGIGPTTDCVRVENASTVNYTLFGVSKGRATNTITDVPRRKTLTDEKVGFWALGNGAAPQPIISTSSAGVWNIPTAVLIGNLNANGFQIGDGTGTLKLGTHATVNNTTGRGSFDGGVVVGNAGATSKVACIKTDRSIGYCSDAPGTDGTCTCN